MPPVPRICIEYVSRARALTNAPRLGGTTWHRWHNPLVAWPVAVTRTLLDVAQVAQR